MDFRQLTSFVHIVRLGSFSRASEFLHIAQPALSRKIQMLEAELGLTLLDRHGRGAVPTSAGMLLLGHADRILGNLRDAKIEMAGLTHNPGGVTRLGIPPSVSECLTSEIFDGLKRRFPRITLQITEGWTGHVRQLLIEDKLDFAVISTSQLDRHFSFAPLLTELICLAHSADASPPPRSLGIKQLAAIPLVLAPLPHGGRLTIDRALKRHGVKANIVLESEVWSVIKDVVQKGIACTLVPKREIHQELKAGTLKAVPLRHPEIPHSLVLGRLAKNKIPPHMREIFAILASHLKQALSARK